MEIVQLTNEQFENFSKNYNIKNFNQTVEYGTLMDRHNFDDYYLGLIDDNNSILAATLILVNKVFIGYKWGYCPRGYLIDYNDFNLLSIFTEKLKLYLKRRNFMFVKIDPDIIYRSRNNKGEITNEINNTKILENLVSLGYEHSGFNLNFENIKPRTCAVTTLNKDDIVFNKYTKEIRNKIRKAEKKGIEVVKGTPQDIKQFYNIIKYKNEKRKLNYYLDMFEIFGNSDMFELYFGVINTTKYVEKSKQLFEEEEKRNNDINQELEENINSNNTNNIIKRKMYSDSLLNNYKKNMVLATDLYKENPTGIIVSATVIIKYNNEIYFLIDGINSEYKSYCANHYVIYQLMNKYHQEGYNRFNLNGISLDFNKNSEYLGLTRFKLGFVAHIEEYLGEFSLIINKNKTSTYKKINPVIEWLNEPVL